MRMLRLLSVLVCGVGLFYASASKAESVEKEHDGLYFRLNAGPSYMSWSNSGNSDLSVSGMGFGFGLAAGHTISDNLMLFAEFAMDSFSEPTAKVKDTELDMKDTSMSATRYGAGVSYYLMPLNGYVTGSLLLGSFSTTTGSVSDSSKTGFGLKVGVGKEWMLAPKFGLGAALSGTYLTAGDKEGSESSSAMLYGLSLSATYN